MGWESCSVVKSGLTWDPIDCSMPGFPVLHYFLKFAQTHVHQVGDAIQPSHTLLSPSPPAFNLSQRTRIEVSVRILFTSTTLPPCGYRRTLQPANWWVGRVVQLVSLVWLEIPLTAACQASLSFTVSWSLLKLMSIEFVHWAIPPSNSL